MKSSSSDAICMHPIGVVHNGISGPDHPPWEEATSQIELAPGLLPALEGIEGFSHLLIVFSFHRRPADRVRLQVHPEGREEMPLVGVLATRSPTRPNPIGVTAVELIGRQGNVLTVRGLDAYEGTPVLDIKPYLRRGDRQETVRVPAWLEQLWTIHDQERGDG